MVVGQEELCCHRKVCGERRYEGFELGQQALKELLPEPGMVAREHKEFLQKEKRNESRITF